MSSEEVTQAEYRAAEKKLVRKVDWILMPILTVTLGLQVRIARSTGMVTDDGSTTTRLSWAMLPVNFTATSA
jgi:hypothetical protein